MSDRVSGGTSPVVFDGRFVSADQKIFAHLSGDMNPVHLDAALARREYYGRRILHGLHGVMRATDAFLAWRGMRGRAERMLAGIRARFLAPVFLGERVRVVLEAERDDGATLTLRHNRVTLYEIDVAWGAGGAVAEALPRSAGPGGAPLDLAFADLTGRHGTMPLELDTQALAACFPELARAMSPRAAAAALTVTRLVGMECPGAQSLLSSFDLRLDAVPATPVLSYRVNSAIERYSLVKMAVEGGGITGTVDAFYRPRCVAQPSYADLRRLVAPADFKGMRALVVGGSRGLGETTAKLLAAGGADVVVTFHRLGGEAARVAAEIRAAGGRCRVVRWDACKPVAAADTLAQEAWHPTHLCFFATPRLELRRGSGFSRELFRSLVRVGVEGLEVSVRAIRRITKGPLHLFLPSTTLLDGDPSGLKTQAEFAAAKAASEALAAALAVQDRHLILTVARLPRVRTDQSQSLSPRLLEAPEDVLRPHLSNLMPRAGRPA